MFDKESETFVVHVAALETLLARITIHPLQNAQILSLIQDKAPTKVPTKYTDYADVFFFNLAIELPQNTSINKHVIELQDGKQPPYRPFYSLGLVELDTLKIYIKTHLKTGLIWLFKSFASVFILLDKKLNGNFRLYINYQSPNNLTTKNRYPLPPIGKSLDQLSRAKGFT